MPELELALRVAANASNVRVVRATVGAAASAQDLTYEDVDDLRIAVDEACGIMLTGSPPAEVLSVTMYRANTFFEVTVQGVGAGPWDDDRGKLPWKIIEGLTDGVETGQTDDAPWIMLRKRIRAVAP